VRCFHSLFGGLLDTLTPLGDHPLLHSFLCLEDAQGTLILLLEMYSLYGGLLDTLTPLGDHPLLHSFLCLEDALGTLILLLEMYRQ